MYATSIEKGKKLIVHDKHGNTYEGEYFNGEIEFITDNPNEIISEGFICDVVINKEESWMILPMSDVLAIENA